MERVFIGLFIFFLVRDLFMPPECVRDQAPGNIPLCTSVGTAYPFVRAPLYVSNNIFDTCLIFTDLGAPNNGSPQTVNVKKKKKKRERKREREKRREEKKSRRRKKKKFKAPKSWDLQCDYPTFFRLCVVHALVEKKKVHRVCWLDDANIHAASCG